MSFYQDLHDRGVVAQETHPEELKQLLESGPITLYTGFDPTAESLTLGHLVPLMLLARAQNAGHKPIALIGSGTTQVGDPTGKTEMRKMLSREQIKANAGRFKGQMSKVLDFEGGRALMVDNGDWLTQLNYLEMLRDIGAHFSVNRMLAAECFKSRLEKGLSFLEFNYMIFQAYDFLVLHDRYGCKLQMGGDDQWSNILAGTDLIRRKRQASAYAMTLSLLTTSDGRKMGKTEKGAIWLDEAKTSPFELYQYLRNIPDDTVSQCLGFFTLLPADEVRRLGALKDKDVNIAKERLAMEVVGLIHGQEEAEKSRSAAHAAFGGGAGERSDLPTTTYARSEIPEGGINILDVLIKAELAKSKGEGRRLIKGGGVRIDGDKVSDPLMMIPIDDLSGEGIELRKGKTFHLVQLTEGN